MSWSAAGGLGTAAADHCAERLPAAAKPDHFPGNARQCASVSGRRRPGVWGVPGREPEVPQSAALYGGRPGKRPGQAPGCTVLLAHNPLLLDSYTGWGADLVLCGHVHGGLVRLPFLGGVLSPERKFFPKYDKGLYEKDGTKMYVSGGIGKPRLCNPPEDQCDSLEKRPEIIEQPVHHGCGGAVEDDRPGDGKNACADAQDPALGACLDGGGNHAVGKACDGDERSCAGVLAQLGVPAQPVQTALTATSPMETHAEAFFCSMPQYSVRIWMPASPMVQISPPIRNARGMFFQDFDRGAV